jgi:hypothetical protein
MWTAEIVRERFIEAAQTELRLPRINSTHANDGFWPEYVHSFQDLSG